MLVKYGSINVCFKLYAEESYSLADSKEGSGGPGVRGSGGPGVRGSGSPGIRILLLLFPSFHLLFPKYLSEVKIIPTL